MTPSSPTVVPSAVAPLSASPLHVVLPDDRQVTALIEALISRSGLSIHEVARRLGVKRESVREYHKGKRVNPSMRWFSRLCAVCGAKLVVEFPSRTNRG